ncbi:extracellular catalytic domain type 1 short-chain-length polyhydroxyalkanoate depolymerase [Dactylosporangium sp. CA-233914]|uniref:extracellular catalytic domain type 1 short-chain-length polyhydroxyalkanoate depolymerase n=1 Tax=Dactylosporangium sp. CA-233914 TaxID=3239934 RepID=UPI003D8A29AF
MLGLAAALTVGFLVAIAQQQTAAAAGAWTSETIAGMNVRVYTPSTPGLLAGKRALMISLHGCVQTNANLQSGANWASTADQYGMVVALPAAPNGGVILGCWDYYDTNHSSSNPARHDDDLLNLVSAMLARTALNLDPNQVYISGLSSGGGETMVMGCLAPDVFAGIGINAGPTVGTTSGQISSVATNQSTGTSVCKQFAGSHTAGFSTQLTSVIYGSNDTTVAPGYDTLDAQIMAGIYGANTTSTFSLSGLAGTNTAGSGTLYSDAQGPRVSLIQNTNLGHNWPAGAQPGGSYISTNSINYPAYLTNFLFTNNRRVDRSTTPTSSPTATPTASPTPTPTPTATPTPTSTLFCGAATNLQHQAAGRATSYGVNPYNPYYANGSWGYMGMGDATVTTLKETAPRTFTVVTSC